MTPEQKFGYHRKTGRMPEDKTKPKKVKYSHGVVTHCGVELTNPLPWALAGYKMKEFKLQGLTGLKLKGVNI